MAFWLSPSLTARFRPTSLGPLTLLCSNAFTAASMTPACLFLQRSSTENGNNPCAHVWRGITIHTIRPAANDAIHIKPYYMASLASPRHKHPF